MAKNALGKQFFFFIFSVPQRWQRPEVGRGREDIGNNEDKDWNVVHENWKYRTGSHCPSFTLAYTVLGEPQRKNFAK